VYSCLHLRARPFKMGLSFIIHHTPNPPRKGSSPSTADGISHNMDSQKPTEKKLPTRASSPSPQSLDQNPRQRSLTWRITLQVSSLLWLAPIIAILFLNFKNYIVGVGIGCFGRCESTPEQRDLQGIDRKNHNILGALQLVAKALEVWFIFIAGCLIYNLSMWLITSQDRLLFSHLLMHIEFADLSILFKPSF
jgi:hypothetical protein